MDGPRSAAEVELVVEALTHGDLEVVGQITDSSNIALLCEVQGTPLPRRRRPPVRRSL